MAQLCQHLGKIGRQGALHGDPLPGAGVDKGEPSGVKALARQAGDGLLGPVYHVPSRGGRWRPDAPGSGGCGRSPDGTEYGYSRGSAPTPSSGSPPDGPFSNPRTSSSGRWGGGRWARPQCRRPPAGRPRTPPRTPGKGVILELGGQGLVGIVVLGGNEQPRCVPVDAVDDAGAEGSVDSGE